MTTYDRPEILNRVLEQKKDIGGNGGNLKYGFSLIIIYQYLFIHCDECPTQMQDVNNGGGGWMWHVQEASDL